MPGGDGSRFLGVPRTFLSFLVVGGMAFMVTELMLFLAYDSPLLWFLPEKDTEFGIAGVEHPDIRLLIASALAVEIAIAFKFLAYENWTFRDRRRPASILVRFVQLNAASLLGAAVTVAVVNVLTTVLGLSPYVSTPAGVVAAFMLNWVASSSVIWPEHEEGSSAPPAGSACYPNTSTSTKTTTRRRTGKR
jgi:putative flippase GtrA